jgi:hypothetical protein
MESILGYESTFVKAQELKQELCCAEMILLFSSHTAAKELSLTKGSILKSVSREN